jgi:hypothetical protein
MFKFICQNNCYYKHLYIEWNCKQNTHHNQEWLIFWLAILEWVITTLGDEQRLCVYVCQSPEPARPSQAHPLDRARHTPRSSRRTPTEPTDSMRPWLHVTQPFSSFTQSFCWSINYFATVISVIFAIVPLIFWLLQCYSAPSNRARHALPHAARSRAPNRPSCEPPQLSHVSPTKSCSRPTCLHLC